MSDDVINKIRDYCINGHMKKDSLKINLCENGYVATDGFTSIMFDKNGKPSSLPMHKLYGDKAASLAGAGFSIYTIVIIAAMILAVICSIFNF